MDFDLHGPVLPTSRQSPAMEPVPFFTDLLRVHDPSDPKVRTSARGAQGDLADLPLPPWDSRGLRPALKRSIDRRSNPLVIRIDRRESGFPIDDLESR